MTEINWSRFEELPGDQTANFELLWRGAIRRTYGKYGTFQARSQQPGVEFHLKLNTDCALGDAGQWFGWQTKWWKSLVAGRAIGNGRKDDVEDSLAKSKIHIPGLTDWILCTRRPLAPVDEPWWDGLKASLTLDLQTAEDLANLLTGDAELLRQTYFGDLILTPERLEKLSNLALADVRERWFPEVHQTTTAESALRRMLAEPDAWGHLQAVGSEITRLSAIIAGTVEERPLGASVQADLDQLLESAEILRKLLEDAHEHLMPGGDHTWRELGEAVIPDPPKLIPRVLRRLRAANHPAALACSNLVIHFRHAAAMARDVFGQLAVRCVTVTGEAGYGKTQLAASLTCSTDSRPAGVLLFGRQLRSRDDLDDLSRRVALNGKKIETFEALLAAVDAAAARAQCRLPIVIDGLNEAENPSEWKPLLERALVLLEDYPSVLLVCTLRSSFVERAIPTSVANSVTLNGFSEGIAEAIETYFDHFKIDAAGVDLPLERFDHPITLRIFCSVTNPTREDRVRLVGRAPSLNTMFGGYLNDVAARIETLSQSRIRAADINNALAALGVEMWETNSREVSESRVKDIFGDTNRLWDDSILNALQEEGVLIRQTSDGASRGSTNPTDGHGELVVAVVYDLLAGYIVASAMAGAGGEAFAKSLSSPEIAARFTGPQNELHPLAIDIFDALVFVLPRLGLGQLWTHVRDDLLDAALLRATDLEIGDIDSGTLDAWTQNIEGLSGRPGFWPRLRAVRAVPNHPFNAIFADAVLRSLTVADRDLGWTEWLRTSTISRRGQAARTSAGAMEDLRLWTARWRNTAERGEADALRARWFMWMLTSTVRDLRDAATAALYWFGREDPATLFELAVGALEINDAYVGERATAAAYGVATAYQQSNADFAEALRLYLHKLVASTSGATACTPTFHRLIRYYIAGTIEFGRMHYPESVPPAAADGIAFADGPMPEPLSDGDARHDEVERTIHTDFGNYTLGRLFADRANYDFEHIGHRNATDQVLGIVYSLGWRQNEFASIDQMLANRDQDRNPGSVERYGKKYGWIGFYLVAGMLRARGERVNWLEVDIDPSFPQISPPLPLTIPSWVGPTPADDGDWLINGEVVIPDELLYTEDLAGEHGPWILVHAELSVKDESAKRGGFGLFNTVALAPHDLDALLRWWSDKEHPGRDLIDLPSAYYLFAGEIPWHTRMVTSGDDLAGTGAARVERDENDESQDPHGNEDPYIEYIRVPVVDAEAPIGTKIIEGPEADAEGQAGPPAGDPPDVPFHGLEEGGDLPGADYLAFVKARIATHLASTPPHRELEVEAIAHTYAWEGHNSSQNRAFAYVPSQRLSQLLSLHSVAAGFNQVDEDGHLAAMSFTAPDGLDGHLLYVREDVVKTYGGDRALVTFGWGEREIRAEWPEQVPESFREAYQNHANVWRTHRVIAHGEPQA
ncbi:hypothetical protein WJX64_12760 [Leifsonia sp. YIM 134122]|uniref:AAA+ ATPase domain-containing protein n=1 Tax=Leifsonia stereocauli TaxID=3134136 RepID=A0ABU9W622_9MICO